MLYFLSGTKRGREVCARMMHRLYHSQRPFFLPILILGVLSIAFFAHAAGNLTGYAWADNGIGWISMNSLNCDPDGNGFSNGPGAYNCPSAGTPIPNYGVTVAANGTMSGYAWANPNDGSQNHIGWINFAPSLTGVPVSPNVPNQTVRFDKVAGTVRGWARVVNYEGTGAGQWDGWIGFGSGGNYGSGVTAFGCSWSGYAWGGGITIGWIRFANSAVPYSVTGSGDACALPACQNTQDDDGDSLTDFPADPGCGSANDTSEAGISTPPSGLSAVTSPVPATCNNNITWTDNSSGPEQEDRFELERKLSSAPDTAYVEIAEPAADTTSFYDAGAVGGFSHGVSYTYRIRACSIALGCSAYSSTASNTNLNPAPQFTWSPPSPLKNQSTSFNGGASAVYGGASVTEYSWTFTNGIPAAFCSSIGGSGCNNPPLTSLASSRFQLPPLPEQKPVTLRVTDSASRRCSLTQPVMVQSGSVAPKWIEVAPE